MIPAIKSDGSWYYEYFLLYTEDALMISENGKYVLREYIGNYFELKEDSIVPPEIYLGGILSNVELENGIKSCTFGSIQYARSAVDNVEGCLK